ncbi:MAG: TIM barrel protein [Candidatus Solibacter sp.]|nr:TIM barrel protein [Candidatus Solibacter sp.]
MTRRSFIPVMAGAAGLGAAAAQTPVVPRKGRLKQGATKGCFGKGMSLEDMCRESARLGLKGLDLSGPADWPTLKKYGLISVMAPGCSGINHKANHEKAEKQLTDNIGLAAGAGMPNVIITFATKQGISDTEATANSVSFLKRVKALAEDKGVTICLELFNSKVNHPDAQADHTKFLVEICKLVESPRVKILFDIYHMQIMEGDIIRTIRDNFAFMGHFHTAGNPGRHEIDDTQELNYRAVARAIVDLDYTGYLSHEYSPLGDPLKSLDQAISICDV